MTDAGAPRRVGWPHRGGQCWLVLRRSRGGGGDLHVSDQATSSARVESLSARGSVEVTDVTKRFGDVDRRRPPDPPRRPGEFFSLLGPVRCGKTTTLQMIAGFELPTTGASASAASTCRAMPPYKRNVNTVFQQYALFPHMCVVENVGFGLRSEAGRRKAEIASSGARDARDREDDAVRQPHAPTALRRPAAARRPRPSAASTGRACCCSTSRSAPSTASCVRRCRSSSSSSRASSASRSSSSPTIRRRP